jgi:transposase
MFTRRKHNRSGTISVVVVDKSGGGFKEIHRVGVAHSEEEATALEAEGRHWIATYGGQQLIDFEGRADKELRTAEDVLSSITSTRLSAAQTIIGKVYDSIGFDEIEDEELRYLVIGRICQPMSKKATVGYLRRHFKDDVSLQKIYRYMDKLNNTQKDRVQEISVRHTQTLFGGNIGILFYDVTTLYFETTDKDELRNNGFSKDGKNANPQVVLGLLVSRGGYPLSYALFNGAQFEGYTMIPIVDDFIQRYNLGSDFVVIADSGLMSEKNVQLLRSAGYKYIIGARIKKESGAMKDLILSTPHEPGVFNDIPYGNGDRLIVGYSEDRARKNEHDRNEGVERLRKRYAKGTLTKADINKRGYNKFLSISSGVTVCIDEAKIEEDKVWDGLKGYRTNTDLPADQVYDNYQQLWNVERAFRITKGTLEVRPMFHFSEKRIEAHVCICFVALKVYKELERLLKISGCPYSVDNVLRIAEVIVTIEVDLPENGKTLTKTIYTSKEERDIAYLIETDDWLNKNG